MELLFLAQGLNLIGCITYYCTLAVLSLPSILMYYFGLRKCKGADDKPDSATFYEGYVLHIRRAPAVNKFRYAVRMAVLDLDAPPSWFKDQAADHMTADQARAFAGTSGSVKLLTDPQTAGYIQNPISVYYCYGSAAAPGEAADAAPQPERCIAEVTNTPWNERVTFVFNPDGQSVRKALHVSPFMDMQNTWHLEAPEPSDRLKLVVRASHPEYGDYFYADLLARRSDQPERVNEEAGLRSLVLYGFMPHRVALLIYWQAVKLIAKGVPLYSPPDKSYQKDLVADEEQQGKGGLSNGSSTGGVGPGGGPGSGSDTVNGNGGCPGSLCPVAGLAAGVRGARQHSHPRNGVTGGHFVWRGAPRWPWREG